MVTIKKAAVIGAGTMGAQIAAHLANVGIPSVLLDVVPTELTPEEEKRGLTLQSPEVRNRVTRTLFERMKKLSPSPFYLPEMADLITIGNVEDHLSWLGEADWVIEAVLERMDLKRDVHAKIAAHVRPDALVTTNTSGLSVNGMIEHLPVEHRRRFFGTHFFNPPRYLRLLEVIPCRDSDPQLVNDFCEFAERVLGKGIVCCKDTPGFVANRVGCFTMQHVIWLMLEEGMTIDEVDAITGTAMGRPRSATFRLGDIVGVDLMAQVGRNFYESLKDDEMRDLLRLPDFVDEMVKRGWHGEKSGQGFYKRVRSPDFSRGSEILTLDYNTMEYKPRQTPMFASVESGRNLADPAERLRKLCAADDKAGKFAWKHLSAVLCYAANRIPEIADDIVTIDSAMKWGWNWELGPFETWDALGVRETVERLEKEGREVPALVRDLLASGKSSFYHVTQSVRLRYDVTQRDYAPTPERPNEISLRVLRQSSNVIRSNSGASLIDLGDGVACLEFHSKMNALGPDQLSMIHQAQEEVRQNFVGLVIGNQAEHFSVGANLVLILTQIQNQDWDEIDLGIRQFQRATCSLRQFEKPVVAAVHGYTLGGGCEVAMGGDYVMAAAESYVGLPEVGVGVIPGAGGCKEMLIRCTEHAPRSEETDYFPYVRKAWETIGLAKVSTSAHEAIRNGHLREQETTIVLNRDLLIGEAKAKVLQMAAAGYRPQPSRNDIPAIGEAGIAQFKLILHLMRRAEQISDHDVKIGTKLAYVLCGGNLTSLHFVSEQYILDLEREAFLSLCGELKTVERIQHMLKTGRALRN